MHPQPEPPGAPGAQGPTVPASSAAVAHSIDPCSAGSSKCSSFEGRAAGRWGGGSGGPPPQPPLSWAALQTRLPSPAAAARAGSRVPQNLAAANPMLSSHSRQICLYLPAEWARGASSDDDCARCREPGAQGKPRAGRTMALCNRF